MAEEAASASPQLSPIETTLCCPEIKHGPLSFQVCLQLGRSQIVQAWFAILGKRKQQVFTYVLKKMFPSFFPPPNRVQLKSIRLAWMKVGNTWGCAPKTARYNKRLLSFCLSWCLRACPNCQEIHVL